MEDGSTISFKFTEKEVYTIELLNIKKQRNNIQEVIDICKSKKRVIEEYIEEKIKEYEAHHKAIVETNELNANLY